MVKKRPLGLFFTIGEKLKISLIFTPTFALPAPKDSDYVMNNEPEIFIADDAALQCVAQHGGEALSMFVRMQPFFMQHVAGRRIRMSMTHQIASEIVNEHMAWVKSHGWGRSHSRASWELEELILAVQRRVAEVVTAAIELKISSSFRD